MFCKLNTSHVDIDGLTSPTSSCPDFRKLQTDVTASKRALSQPQEWMIYPLDESGAIFPCVLLPKFITPAACFSCSWTHRHRFVPSCHRATCSGFMPWALPLCSRIHSLRSFLTVPELTISCAGLEYWAHTQTKGNEKSGKYFFVKLFIELVCEKKGLTQKSRGLINGHEE